jgi:hypothetical protein
MKKKISSIQASLSRQAQKSIHTISRVAIFSLVLVFVTGCAIDHSGPVNLPNQKFADFTSNVIPAGDGKMQIYGFCLFYKDGRTTSMTGSLTPLLYGALAITDKAVNMLQWDQTRKRYYLVKRILISDILSVEYGSVSYNKPVIIQSGKFQYDTFDFRGPVLPDQAKNDQALAFLRERIRAH